ncbi:MAG: hypothetical protein AMXMBFR47_14220 [Planctomycetota bacterium]
MRHLFAFLTIAMGAATCSADLKATINTAHPDRDGSISGGPFWAFDASTGGDQLPDPQRLQFTTFCVETTETLTNATYFVEISTSAMNGGAGGGTPDPLSGKSAWLYYMFRTNPTGLNTGGYVFDGDQSQRYAANRALQEALWWIEQETGGVNNALVTLATDFGWADDYLGNVRVMRLWDTYTDGAFSGNHQDVLLLIPVPAAAVLGLLGLGIAGWVKRRSL